jgi:amino acid permease
MLTIGAAFETGLTRTKIPGSLLHPAPTSWWPENWEDVPLTFGLITAGFSGHSVFPTIYRDMRVPSEYPRMVQVTYTTSLTIYVVFAGAGYLMFGQWLLPEVTQNLGLIPSYEVLAKVTLVMVILAPLTKYPLATFPVSMFVEGLLLSCGAWLGCCGHAAKFDADEEEEEERAPLLPADAHDMPVPHHSPTPVHLSSRVLVSALVLTWAIAIPDFHNVMALLGSLFSFGVSILFPLVCYMRLVRLSWLAWWGHALMFAASAVLCVWGTYAATLSALAVS